MGKEEGKRETEAGRQRGTDGGTKEGREVKERP